MRTPHAYATSELRLLEIVHKSNTEDLILTKEAMRNIIENAYIEGAIKSRMR